MTIQRLKACCVLILVFGLQSHPQIVSGHGPSGGGSRGGGGGGGGFRGGAAPTRPAEPTRSPGTAAPSHSPAAPARSEPGRSEPPHSVGIHGGAGGEHPSGGGAGHPGFAPGHAGPAGGPHGGFPAGHPGFEHGGIHEAHLMHSPGPHWNGYHQAYIGSRPVRLAYAGYHPSYYYHPWYHGPWRGYAFGWGWGFGPGIAFGIGGAGWGLTIGTGYGYGPYGPYGYWGYPLGWGFGGWGLGGIAYSSGYYPYYNPYYSPVVYQTVVYDYSRPIPVATRPPEGDADAPRTTDPNFETARMAFRDSNYEAALRDVDRAIVNNSSDAVLHEFRALVLFALHDYRQSAATLHSLLSIGPGWDWTTMSSLYGDPLAYTDQLRSLESYVRSHPQSADGRFVLAYHYMIGGHKDVARTQLQQVVQLMPSDRLAGELLRMVSGPPPEMKTSNDDPFPDPPPSGAPIVSSDIPASPSSPGVGGNTPDPIDKERLPGTWRANRSDGSKFGLTLTGDGKFRWKYANANQKGEEFGGSYSVDGPVLILERSEGGALAGTVAFTDDDHLNFKLVGAPPDDQGLQFTR